MQEVAGSKPGSDSLRWQYVLIAIITGIVIDAFGGLRDKKDEAEENIKVCPLLALSLSLAVCLSRTHTHTHLLECAFRTHTHTISLRVSIACFTGIVMDAFRGLRDKTDEAEESMEVFVLFL